MQDVDGLNSGYARLLLEEYLENPESVPREWRALFESGSSELVATHPGLLRLLEKLAADGHPPGTCGLSLGVKRRLSGLGRGRSLLSRTGGGAAVSRAAMASVKAYRTHGHLAARLDPLGSDPVGDPALDPDRLVPRLTKDLSGASPRRSCGSPCRAPRSKRRSRTCRRRTAGRSPTRSSTSPTTRSAWWLREAIGVRALSEAARPGVRRSACWSG